MRSFVILIHKIGEFSRGVTRKEIGGNERLKSIKKTHPQNEKF
jgi:hypothetical protein